MSTDKARRKAAEALVVTYYEAELAGLLQHVAAAIEQYRAGELDVHGVDDLIHRYKKATKELWKFCWLHGGSHLERVAHLLELRTAEVDRPDWWEAAAPRRRDEG